MLQLHLSDQQFNCLLKHVWYKRLDGSYDIFWTHIPCMTLEGELWQVLGTWCGENWLCVSELRCNSVFCGVMSIVEFSLSDTPICWLCFELFERVFYVGLYSHISIMVRQHWLTLWIIVRQQTIPQNNVDKELMILYIYVFGVDRPHWVNSNSLVFITLATTRWKNISTLVI